MKIVSNEPFKASRDGIRQLTVVANGGTATLKALTGDNTPVPMDNNSLAIDGIITFYAVTDQEFYVTLTGNAEAWLAG